VNGARIFVLGVAYKRGVGDTSESSALEIMDQLRTRGADVSYADPYEYAAAVERAPLVVDARNATWGLAPPESRVVRL